MFDPILFMVDASVTLVVRGDTLEAGMSEYLITRLRATPNVQVRLQSQMVEAVERAVWRR